MLCLSSMRDSFGMQAMVAPRLISFLGNLKAMRRKVCSSTLPLVVRARDTALVFSEPNPSDGAFELITVFTSIEASLMITCFMVSPSDCEMSFSWSSSYTVIQHVTSVGQAASKTSSADRTLYKDAHWQRHLLLEPLLLVLQAGLTERGTPDELLRSANMLECAVAAWTFVHSMSA